MKKNIILTIAILGGIAIACKKSAEQPALKDKILGKWLVVSNNNFHNDNGIVAEWGGYYVASVKINKDNTFVINGDSGSSGTWKLNDPQDKLKFYTWVNVAGVVIADTTEFKVSIDTDRELVLEKAPMLLRHKKIN